jgi:hypothetical protein
MSLIFLRFSQAAPDSPFIVMVCSKLYVLFVQHFHKLHHTYKQPTAFSVTAIHPVEFLSIQAIYIAPMFLLPMHAG